MVPETRYTYTLFDLRPPLWSRLCAYGYRLSWAPSFWRFDYCSYFSNGQRNNYFALRLRTLRPALEKWIARSDLSSFYQTIYKVERSNSFPSFWYLSGLNFIGHSPSPPETPSSSPQSSSLSSWHHLRHRRTLWEHLLAVMRATSVSTR